MKHYRARPRGNHANTDNSKYFAPATTAFGNTRLWVHAKPSQCNRKRRQALKLIWSNQLGVHALDKCNTKSHKDIRALDYHGEKKRKNWQAYVIGQKKYQDFQTAPVEQEFNDFTDRKKVTLLINGIK